MDNGLLLLDIEKRTSLEMSSKTFSRPFHKFIVVNSPDFFINLGIDLYYIVNEIIDVPIEWKISISSGDNYMRTSRTEYENLFYKVNSFRNYLQVKTRNYKEFQPFKLEILIIVPE